MHNTNSTRVAYLFSAFLSVPVFPGLADNKREDGSCKNHAACVEEMQKRIHEGAVAQREPILKQVDKDTLYLHLVYPRQENVSSGVFDDGRVWGRDEDGTITILESYSTTIIVHPDKLVEVKGREKNGSSITKYLPNGETVKTVRRHGPVSQTPGSETVDFHAANSRLLESLRKCLHAEFESTKAADFYSRIVNKEKTLTIEQGYIYTREAEGNFCEK